MPKYNRFWKLFYLHQHTVFLFWLLAYLCAMRKLSMDELDRKSVEEFKESPKIPVIAVLENVRSAYNVGSVFRTADAFLIEAIYIMGYTAKPPHKEIKKTALGAEETVSWKHFTNAAEAIQDIETGWLQSVCGRTGGE